MEFIAPKLIKSRTQKRQKRLIKNRRRNQRKKFEVKSSRQRKTPHDKNDHALKQNANYCTMSASAFWENYKVAHDWQHRHNVAWWKSRCTALEEENCALRVKIIELVESTSHRNQMKNIPGQNYETRYYEKEKEIEFEEEREDERDYEGAEGENIDLHDEALEFHVDEDMMKFLEQSIRHKMELKRMRESENRESGDDDTNTLRIESHQSIIDRRIEDYKSLYGTASSRILAMETALQTAVDHHKDRAKPHYWPNIPLKP